MRWAAAEGVSETVIAAVLLLHERSVKEIAAELSAAELDQVVKLVARSPRVYPPGTLDALKQRRALVSPEPPPRSGESTRSEVAAGKQHARTLGADRRGQPETRTPARPDAGADDRRSVIEGGSPRLRARGKQMACSRNDLQCLGPSQSGQRLLVELNDAEIGATDDQNCWNVQRFCSR